MVQWHLMAAQSQAMQSKVYTQVIVFGFGSASFDLAEQIGLERTRGETFQRHGDDSAAEMQRLLKQKRRLTALQTIRLATQPL